MLTEDQAAKIRELCKDRKFDSAYTYIDEITKEAKKIIYKEFEEYSDEQKSVDK